MHVAKIIDTKGANVVTLRPTATLAEAAHTLARHKIGAVLVTDEEEMLVGILSERDIVRAVAALGASALDAPLSAHMTADVQTTEPSELIASIMERMTQGRFRHLPVLQGKRIVGIVSIGDVVKFRVAMIEAEASAMRDYIASA